LGAVLLSGADRAEPARAHAKMRRQADHPFDGPDLRLDLSEAIEYFAAA
jgi:hypothetical protein